MTKLKAATQRSLSWLWIALLLIAVVAATAYIPGKAPAGYGDFQAYWSASYLLAHGQNFSDPDLMFQVEQELTGWSQDYVMLTWNPPWLMALLIPLTWISFQRAAWLWLILSIVSIFTASLLSWRIVAGERVRKRFEWMAPVAAFVFVPTLIGLLAGQINHLVFLGLAVFLFFADRKRPFMAGMGLALTLVKPHLVYVTVPILLLKALSERKWRIWLGLGSVVLLLTGIVLLLRPTFLLDYGRSLQAGSLTNWQTPTLSGILAMQFGWTGSKWMGVVVWPLMLGLWYQYRRAFSYSVWLNSTLLVSVITVPFGWGYDAIVLLLPIFQMIAWALIYKKYRRNFRLVIPFLLIIDGLLFYQRFAGTNEVYYFWLPIVIAGLYFLTLAWQTSPQLKQQLGEI